MPQKEETFFFFIPIPFVFLPILLLFLFDSRSRPRVDQRYFLDQGGGGAKPPRDFSRACKLFFSFFFFFFVLATITTRSFWYFHLQIDYTTYRRVARRACSAFRESATSAHPDDRCSSWYRRPATWVAPPVPPGPVPARLPGTKMSISAF